MGSKYHVRECELKVGSDILVLVPLILLEYKSHDSEKRQNVIVHRDVNCNVGAFDSRVVGAQV